MKILAFSKKVIFTIFAVLFSVNLWGQAPTPTLSLLDPEAAYNATTNPYVVTSAEDWGKLASDVAGGYSYDGEVIKLTADISVSTMVGAEGKPFSGTFNGYTGVGYGLYTLTFNYGTSGSHTDEEIVAPFRYTKSATITYLQVSGAIHTDAGKEAGLIGVNTRTDHNTTVEYVIVDLDLYCYESLWEEEGGGFAYDGRGVSFSSCAYKGYISTNNYQGGFCGNGDSNTTFVNCLFNPEVGGVYWAENFVYNEHGATISYSSCYYTEGNNQEESEQGYLVYVGSVPTGSVGCYMTNLYGQNIYEPVAVVISGVSGTYIYNGSVISVTPEVTFDGVNAISNEYCTTSISPSTVQNVGTYTLSVTGQNAGEGHNYSGTVTKDFRVVEATDDWAKLQDTISNKKTTITLYKDYTAVSTDDALTIDRNVTINLNGHTIDRGFYDESTDTWDDPAENGQVIRINKNCAVVINGPGTITGGYNKAKNYNENSDNDGGGINNLGTLTLNNVTVTKNRCVKKGSGTSRTARGGGIYSGKGSRLTIVGGAVTYNESEGGGGGIYSHQATLFSIDKEYGSDDNTAIHGNKSLDKGGGIRVDAGETATIKNCDIYNNSVELHDPQSASNGGGIHLDAGRLDIENCVIFNNWASKYGGGIYTMGGQIHVKDSQVQYNQSYDETNYFEGYGGGVCIMGGKYYMDGGTVTGNSSNISKGGGIFVNVGSTLYLKGNVNISGNWMFDENDDEPITNVYIKDKSGVITIESGFDSGSLIGVAKNHSGSTPPGVFTKNLTTNGGSLDNFISDEASYQVLPADGEAKLAVPAEMPSTIDPDNPPEGITYDDENDRYEITEPFTIDDEVTIGKNVIFGTNGSIVIEDTGILIVPSITNDDPTKLVIENHGQIIFTSSPSDDIIARIKKDIERGYDSGENWYLISSPINTPYINKPEADAKTNLITVDEWGYNKYDLYRFNEAATETNEQGQLLQWENYRSTDPTHSGFSVNQSASTLENGRGYLYRYYYDYTIIFEGYLNVPSSVEYTLSYSGTNQFKGFHLIGNPYPHDIYKNDEYQSSGDKPAINDANLTVGYYELYREEYEQDRFVPVIGYNHPIKTSEGILVQTTFAHTLTITNTTNPAASYTSSKCRGDSGYDNIMFEVANNKAKDVAYAMFVDGVGLSKIEQLSEETPMLYVRQNNQDYAIATMSHNTKQFNLNFEAKNTGKYTLTVNPQGHYRYLHLIDKVAEEDIDLLAESKYSFIGSPSDRADRFVVRLETSENVENSIFAYQSGDEIVVSGEGELQVFDVMGRLVMQKHVNGVETVEKPMATGVYILKLNDQTQKMVIQ